MDPVEYDSALLTTKPFKYLNFEELNIIKGYCKLILFKKNETLFTQGKQNDGMYILLKGQALVIAKLLGKNILNLATLYEGNFFGEISLIQKNTCAATVIAKDDVECLKVSTNYFDMLAVFYPEVRFKITKAITEEVCARLAASYQLIKQSIEKTNISHTENKTLKSLELTTFEDARLHKSDLKRSEFFANYKEEEVDIFLNYAELIKSPKDCTIIKQGEMHSAYYLIIRGAILLSVEINDKKAKLTVLGPFTIFGSMSWINKMPTVLNID